MQQARTVALGILIALLLLGAAAAIHDYFVPPYSDREIRESIVDTWEVEAFGAASALVLMGSAIALALRLAYRSKGTLSRRMAAVAVALAASAAMLTLLNHITLTKRTSQLTGQSFGAFYGLR